MYGENEFEKAYAPSEIAELFSVNDSTLRKWCHALERNGYRFLKDENERRVFTEHDVIALKQLQAKRRSRKMNMEQSASLVAQEFSRDKGTVGTVSVPMQSERADERYFSLMGEIEVAKKEFTRYMQQREAFERTLLEEMKEQKELIKQQQSYIENGIKERDERLVQAVREIQETKLQLVATFQEEKKKRKWWKFW